MHDIVAHSLSVMITLADGATATCQRDPVRTRTALEALTATGRSALRDMGQLLSVLREPTEADGERRPAPTANDVAELVESYRGAGLPVRHSVTGTPRTDAGRELTAYRIIQEALTNVLRYAVSPTDVVVAIDHRPPALRITVTDDGGRVASDSGRSAAAGADAVGSGRGLVGMSERAAVYGGRVEACPLAAGGWRVHAVLPYDAAEDAADVADAPGEVPTP